MNLRLVTILINRDDYEIINIISRYTGKSEAAAATALMEIGLYNILTYPTGKPTIDNILANGQWPAAVEHIRKIWGPLKEK